jgi:uncharacterized protein (DUF2062 family)
VGSGVAAASVPSTGADTDFAIGIALLIAGSGVVAGARRLGRRN